MNKENELLNYAVWLLARRPYHTAELRKKIVQKKKVTIEEAEGVIHKLETYKYLNDKEYLSLFIRDQLNRKPQGLALIKQKLLQKGIPKGQIESALALQSSPELELEQAQKAIRKKLQTLKAASPLQKKQKIYRFLISRGFSQGLILKILHQTFSG